MGRFNKKMIVIVMLIGIFSLTGCDKLRLNTFDASDEKSSSEVTVVPDINQDNVKASKEAIEKTSQSGASATPTPSSAMQPTANKELPVYNVNTDGEIQPVTALVPADSKINAELIVAKVLEALEDQSITIETDQVSTNKDEVIVSFVKDKAPFSNMGSGYEQAILDAIAQSLFDNLDSCNKVIYHIEGKAYKSGAFEYGINEAYLER